MEALAVIVILLHPLAALAIIREFFKQRKWRQERAKLPNDGRNEAISRHEKTGNKIFIYVILVICLAFVSKIIYFQINNGVVTFSDLIPNHFHGWAGIIGLFLMIYLRHLGIETAMLAWVGWMRSEECGVQGMRCVGLGEDEGV